MISPLLCVLPRIAPGMGPQATDTPLTEKKVNGHICLAIHTCSAPAEHDHHTWAAGVYSSAHTGSKAATEKRRPSPTYPYLLGCTRSSRQCCIDTRANHIHTRAHMTCHMYVHDATAAAPSYRSIFIETEREGKLKQA